MRPPEQEAWHARLEAMVDACRGTLTRRWLGLRHPGLTLPRGTRLEPDLLWRLAPRSQLVLGAACHVRRGVEFKVDDGAVLQVGSRVHIGPWCTFSVLERLEIGDDCLIAEGVSIRDHDHAFDVTALPYATQGYRVAPVRLGANVWLGARVTIVKGVSLGDGCVVAAGAVVTRSFPEGSLLAGVPARLVRTLPASRAG